MALVHDSVGPNPSSPPSVDLEAVRGKYRQERDKRLRSDGIQQYRPAADAALKGMVDDPFVEPGFTRAPVVEEVETVILGGGFSALCVAARLRDVGCESLQMIESAGDFGGTWYWNRYPGVQCDIESYIYLPLLEELGTMPTLKYAYGPEIFAHAQNIGRHYDLYPDALFQTQVTRAEWDESADRWTVSTNRGDRLSARFLVVASGPLSRPKLPAIAGIEQFEGHAFHTCRWDYDYTERWAEGVRTYHGLFANQFPNCILLGGLQSRLTPNFTELYDEQSQHIAHVIDHARRRGFTRVEPSVEAEASWVKIIRESGDDRSDFAEKCTPGYYNNEGQPNEGPGWFGGTFSDGPQAYLQVLRDWRERGGLDGMTFR